MTTRRGWLRRALPLLAFVLLGAAAPAGARPPRPHDVDPAGEITRHADRLGLDAQTRDAIGEILREAGAHRDALEAERRAARERLRALLSETAPSEEAVMQQVDALGALETAAHKDRLRAMMRIRALLSPEQRAELVRIREEQPGRRGRFRRCAEDLQRHCADARGADALRCLAANWDELAPGCRDAIDRLAGPPRD